MKTKLEVNARMGPVLGAECAVRRLATWGCLLAMVLFATTAMAQRPTAPPVKDPDLPQPFDANLLTPLITNSPFNRAVNLSESLVLTGMAAVNGKPMVTLMDKALKRTYVVTDEPNEDGWKLAEAPPQVALKRAQVKISIGSEVVTIRHDIESQEESMKKDKHAPGGKPGGDPKSEDRGYKHGHSGPSQEQRERWEKLSDPAKEKFKNMFRENRDRIMSMTDEQRRAFMESNFKTIEQADTASRSGK